MLPGLGRRFVLIFAVIFLIGSCFADANAQKRRTKKSRRVTNPVKTTASTPASTPSNGDPTIVSTAEDSSSPSGTGTSARGSKQRRTTAPEADQDATREKVDRLTAQVTALNEKLSQMELQQRTLVDLERLSRAETRAEVLRAQLRDVQSKQAELQARALQIEYEIQPIVIERTLASTGSTRPEDLREARRRQLDAERTMIQSQLNQLTNNRSRLEAAIATAETEADRLRARIDTFTEPAATDTISTDVGAPPVTPTDAGSTGEGPPQ